MNLSPLPSALLALLALGPEPRAPQEASDPLPAPDAAITAADLRHHVGILAADELRGREAGTPDAVRAARYLARALEQAGLEPGCEEGFLQPVPLVRFEFRSVPELVLAGADGESVPARYGADFSLQIQGEPRSTPRLRILVVRSAEELPAEPDPEIALLLEGSRSERREWLEARGQDGGGWGLLLRSGPRTAGAPRDQPRAGRLTRAADVGADQPEVVTLRGPLVERVLAGELVGLELAAGAERVDLVDYNVVGLLRGAGTPERPQLAQQALVLSAHYDHIGVREGDSAPAEGDGGEAPEVDLVFNGADDDASGTAAVLELAEAFAARGAPARTLVFLLAAGEEKGLLGTRHYLEHPAVPLEHTLLNLNFEMVGRPDAAAGGPGRLWLTGDEHTTLGPALRAAGHPVVPDPRPEQDFYRRSDNYAFVMRGVLGQTLSSYDLHEDYHRVSDEADTLDYEHMEDAVRTAFEAASLVASGALTPEPAQAAPAAEEGSGGG